MFKVTDQVILVISTVPFCGNDPSENHENSKYNVVIEARYDASLDK